MPDVSAKDVSAKDVSAKTWRRTFRQKKRLKTFAETFRMICGAYPVYTRSPSPWQRQAPTTIASLSPFPLGLGYRTDVEVTDFAKRQLLLQRVST